MGGSDLNEKVGQFYLTINRGRKLGTSVSVSRVITTEYDLQWLVAGRIAAGRGLAITYKMQVQQPTKTFCNFMQKRLAKNSSDHCKN